MKTIVRSATSYLLFVSLLLGSTYASLACGPSTLLPAFTIQKSPEFPFNGFASGELGIVRREFPRIVLFAAYRYLNGGTFSAYEREQMAEAWMEYYDRADRGDDGSQDAVKDWIEVRAGIVKDEETPPDIYTEKGYWGYQFFPNCAEDAFVVAADTLSDRSGSNGSDDPAVQEWIKGQDAVFRNCSDSRTLPAQVNSSMPVWLQRDRKYQIAAAEFYSLNYQRAKDLFSEISNDIDSPWQEVSEYLVGRTLVRQASLTRETEKSRSIYLEAEQVLANVSAKGGEYGGAAERLLGAVKYRIHPEERVQELAQNLSYYGGDNLKQDLIDYTWLLDKFEKQALEKAEAAKNKDNPFARLEFGGGLAKPKEEQEAEEKGLLFLRVYSDNYSEFWSVLLPPDATDEDAFREAEQAAGPLSDTMKQRIRDARRSAYQDLYNQRNGDYDGGYYGDEKTAMDILPRFLLTSDLTDWLFAFQIEGEGAYEYAFNRYLQTNSDAWLIAAVSKASRSSRDLPRLLESAKTIPPTSPAFPTATYHRARLAMEAGSQTEARRLIDEALGNSYSLPVSARNEFLAMRLKLSETLDDFLRYSLRKPFALNDGADYVTLDELIALEKSYYSPEYSQISREEHDREVEERYAYERAIQGELMLDSDSVEIINHHFPLPVLLQIQNSPLLPDYLRGRLALAIWTRAVMLDDMKTADAIAPEVLKHHPELEPHFSNYMRAASVEQRKHAALYVMLKNDRVTPYINGGFGSPFEGISYGFTWWCEPFEETWDSDLQQMVPVRVADRPPFLTAAQSQQARDEMNRLKEIGSAPSYLAERALAWARSAPADVRLPEALHIAWTANDWDKYGCGSNPEIQTSLANVLKTRYPSSDYTREILEREN